MDIYSCDQALIAYNQLIESNKNTPKIKSQTECHHIIPRAHGGNDDQNNLVNLYHRDHFLAHYYLWKIHKDEPMTYAFFMMFNQNRRKLDESLLYEYANEYQLLKEQYSENLRKKVLTDETKAKISNANKGRILSDATRAKMSNNRKGKTLSEQHRFSIQNRKPVNGWKLSAESRKNISDGHKNIPKPSQWTLPELGRAMTNQDMWRVHKLRVKLGREPTNEENFFMFYTLK